MCISVIKTGNISASGGGNINVKSECNISQNNTADKAASAANAVAAAAVTPTANALAAVTTIKDQPNNKLSSVNSITATSAPTSSSSLSTGTIIGIAVPVAVVALVAIYYLFIQTHVPAKSNDSED
jgi:hypothetical protein